MCTYTLRLIPGILSAGEGADDGGRAGTSEVTGQPGGGLEERGQVHAVLDAESGEEPDEILGGEVASRALGVGAAAEAPGAAVERRDSGEQSGVGVGEGLAVGVVEVESEGAHVRAGAAELVDQCSDVAGGAHADGVAEAELTGAEVEQTAADRDDLPDGHGALPWVAEAHRDVGPHVEAGVAGAAYDRLEHRELLVQRAVQVLLRERLRGAAEDRDVAAPELEGAVEATLVGHQDR